MAQGAWQPAVLLVPLLKAPHRSWVRAPRHTELYKDVQIPKPDTWDKDPARFGKPRAFVQADNRIGGFDDVKSLDSFLKDYYATLVAVDENVGRVLDALESSGKLDNTAILYTSDNGFFAGEWNMFDKRFMHEPSIRVPMLFRYPKMVAAAATCDSMVLNIDIAPTVLDLAEVQVPAWMHGRSMRPLLAGQPVEWRKDWYYEYYEFPGPHSVRKQRGVRTERFKLIHYFQEPEEFELYDLQQDPGELNNLHGKPEHAELLRQLRGRIDDLRRETGDHETI
jgi:arylsulfatase A-like enzyme